MKRTSKSNNVTNNNATNASEGVKAMKRTSKSNNVANNNATNASEGVKAMKRTSKSNNVTNNNATNASEGVKAMKRTSKSNNVTNNNATNNPALQAAQILASLDPAILAAIGLTPAKTQENLKAQASDTGESKSQKADRTYEIPSIGADFVKSGIYARPTSEAAAQYVAKSKALCSDVIDNLTAPIATVDLEIIADKAEKNGGETLKDDLLKLAEKWEIPAQSMRVIMQLCAPVVGVCNAESDEIARRVYGMARANALMGSACNTLMYAKATDKEKALPFKRVCHNCTSLGLDFDECASVEECDFCDNDEDFGELVGLCDMWLAKCTRKNAAPEPKSSPRRALKNPSPESKSSPVIEDKSAQILAALQALLNK